ncbi:MAG: aldo/keto reductase [Chloroflexi bacterium]|nr:aldo/keto reductase [Chloroflexota bacterium]
MDNSTNTTTHAEQRKLGGSGLLVPALGVGVMSWGFGILGYGKTHSRDDIEQAFQACLDNGLNFFDTAEGYGGGESERLLGEISRKARRPILIASKFGPNPLRSSADDLRTALDASLQRLGVEQIDLYQIHMPPPRRKLDELLDALAKAVKNGKVRAVGVSNFNTALLRHAHARLASHGIPLASNQIHYNLLFRYPEANGMLDACRELDVALIAFGPLAEGVLTGKFRPGGLAMSRARWFVAQLTRLDPYGEVKGVEPPLKRLLATPRWLQRDKLEPLFEAMSEIARVHEKTLAQVALNWLLMVDPHVIPIPGAKNRRQAQDNANALHWRLSDAEYQRISAAEIATR